MKNKKGYKIINPIANQERFSHYYCYYLFWVAVGYYLWKKILTITGYRFHPTDFELLHYYLHNKNLGRDSLVQAIADVEDICGLEPWQLPGHSNIHSGDQVWYFFYRPCFKYQNSSRINRTTNEGYWKPTGKPRKIMARDMETEIGKKRTLVFYKVRVGDNNKIKTGWIMHEYELNATLPNQTTFVLCKLKRKFGEGDISYIEESQSSHYLPPNLGNYIANNANEAEAARRLTDKSDPNEMLAQLGVLDDRERLDLEHRSIEWCNSYLLGDSPENDCSDNLVFDSRNHVAENATPDHQLPTEIPPIEDQSGTNQQDSNLGNLFPADERSNQHKLDNGGSTMPSNSKNDTAEDSVQMDLSVLGGPSTDEIFAELETLPEAIHNASTDEFFAELETLPEAIHNASTDELFAELDTLPEDQGNRPRQMVDDWISSEEIPEDQEINIAFDNQCSTNEDRNLTAIGMIGSPHATSLSRKRSRTDHQGFGYDMKSH